MKEDTENKITRAEFLKKSALGMAAVALAAKFGTSIVPTPSTTQSKSSGGTCVSAVAPSDKTVVWIDTAHGGITKYWNGHEWKSTVATWG